MTTFIALLRGINVGSTRKLPMAELREIAEGLGARDVSTFIASGNLLVDVDDPEAFDRALEHAIEEHFGFFREAISRSPEELRAAWEAHPFEVVEKRFSYVTFLATEPTSAAPTARSWSSTRRTPRCSRASTWAT